MVEKQQVQVDYQINSAQAEAQGNKLLKTFDKLKASWLAGTAALAGLIGIISKGLKDFSDQEQAVTKLNQAMKNSGTFTEAASKELQDYATQLQKTTVYADEAILGGQALIASFGIEGEELKALTRATLDLATAKGMDLNAAFDLVGKTVGSSTNALSRYGIEVEGAAGTTGRATSALEGITKLYGGQANAQAQTFAGSIIRLKNAFGELSETVGKAFAPIVQNVSDFLFDVVDRFNSLDDSVKTAIVLFGSAVIAILALIPVLGALAAAFAAIGVTASIALLGIPLIIAGIVAGIVLFQKQIDTARIAVNDFAINFLKKFRGIIDILNKFPGLLHIDVDAEIEKLDKVNDALERKLSEGNAIAEEKAKERIRTVAEIELADKENRAEMQAIEDEAKKIREEEEMQAFRDNLLMRSSEELASAGYTAEQVAAIKTLKDKQQKDQAKQLSKDYINFVGQAAEEEKDIAKAVAKGTLEFIKEGLKKQILAKAAEISETGFALLLASLGTDPRAYAHIAAGGVLAAAGVAAIDSVQLAEGGSMVVDRPTRIGNNVIAGEAGPEKIDVTPLDQSQQTIVNNIYIGDELVSTKIMKIAQGMRAEGTLDDGL